MYNTLFCKKISFKPKTAKWLFADAKKPQQCSYGFLSCFFTALGDSLFCFFAFLALFDENFVEGILRGLRIDCFFFLFIFLES